MYSLFWLNQTVYHSVSLILHFIVTLLVFVLVKKIFRQNAFAGVAAMLFMILSGFSESIFWISATGFLFTACFSLLSLLSYIFWRDSKKTIYVVGAISFYALSMLFHELGIVTPILYILYSYTIEEKFDARALFGNVYYRLMHVLVGIYIVLRYLAHSHWLNGDYSYNIFKLPLNFLGNAIGYFLLAYVGPMSQPIYIASRSVLKNHVVPVSVLVLIIFVITYVCFAKYWKRVKLTDRRQMLFGGLFFFVGLLPFLGLGNMSSRYGYFASIGLVIVLVVMLKKLHEFLQESGQAIASLVSVTVVLIFMLFQVIQLQQAHNDWRDAGEISRKFFTTIDSIYEDHWATAPVEFHFANVPIRLGEAWVFPVGLPDALWLIFRNDHIKVFTWKTAVEALSYAAYDPQNVKILEFDSQGNLQELKKVRIAQ